MSTTKEQQEKTVRALRDATHELAKATEPQTLKNLARKLATDLAAKLPLPFDEALVDAVEELVMGLDLNLELLKLGEQLVKVATCAADLAEATDDKNK